MIFLGLPQSPPEATVGDVNKNDRVPRRHSPTNRRTFHAVSCTVPVADGDRQNPALDYSETGKMSVAGEFNYKTGARPQGRGPSPFVGGFFRDVDSTDVWSSSLGRSRKIRPPAVRPSIVRERDDASGNQPLYVEGNAGKDEKQSPTPRETRPIITNLSVYCVSGDGSDSELKPTGSRPPDDRYGGVLFCSRFGCRVCALDDDETYVGLDCGTEDLVPGHDDGHWKRVGADVELSPRSKECLGERVVDDLSQPRQADGSGETERRGHGVVSLGTPMVPYPEVFGLDGAAVPGAERGDEQALVCAELDPQASALETLLRLESAMRPADITTTTDFIPMDIDTILSLSTPKRFSPGEGKPWGEIPRNSLDDPPPFQPSGSSFSTLTVPPLSSTVVRDLAFTKLDLGPPLPPVGDLASLGAGFESTSALTDVESAGTREVIAGPRLFQPLEDDGME